VREVLRGVRGCILPMGSSLVEVSYTYVQSFSRRCTSIFYGTLWMDKDSEGRFLFSSMMVSYITHGLYLVLINFL
jgi:hypothetical protein